jgi:hypothetical protein
MAMVGSSHSTSSSKEVLRGPVEFGHYLSIRYTNRLVEAGAVPSVGSVGDSYDHALAETIIGLYKTEVIHPRGPWRHLDAVEYATLKWVDGFNHRRRLEPIGPIPPAELEAAYDRNSASGPSWPDSTKPVSGKAGAIHLASRKHGWPAAELFSLGLHLRNFGTRSKMNDISHKNQIQHGRRR